MTTKALMPAYRIEAKDLSGKKQPISQTFKNSCLLTARQGALQYAQELQTRSPRTYVLELAMHLVEIDRTLIGSSPKIIYTIFQKQFQPNMNHPKRLGVIVNQLKNSEALPTSVNMLVENATVCSSQTSWNEPELTPDELDYYHTHGYDAVSADKE